VFAIVNVGLVMVAQEAQSTDEGSAVVSATDDAVDDVVAQDAGNAMDWQEAIFVLLVIAIVMAGLIGFEWIHRRKQSYP